MSSDEMTPERIAEIRPLIEAAEAAAKLPERPILGNLMTSSQRGLALYKHAEAKTQPGLDLYEALHALGGLGTVMSVLLDTIEARDAEIAELRQAAGEAQAVFEAAMDADHLATLLERERDEALADYQRREEFYARFELNGPPFTPDIQMMMRERDEARGQLASIQKYADRWKAERDEARLLAERYRSLRAGKRFERFPWEQGDEAT